MNERYDVIILGAGINGVAAAKALAKEGRSVLVIEKRAIGSGASSHSSRLIHGGLRYLEHGEFSLVKEALHDQKYLLDTYPELVKLRPFYLPLYEVSRRPAWVIGIGLWIYGFFSGHQQRPEEVDKHLFLRQFSQLKQEGLQRVYRYYDAKTDDLALTRKLAEEARESGVEILEETEPTEIFLEDEKILVRTQTQGYETHCLVNATGAWVDEINARFNLPSRYTIEKLSGIHLVIDRVLVPEPLILQTDSNRVFFIIPEEKTTLIGTTERSEEVAIDEVRVNNEDIEYLLAKSNAYLKRALSRKDISEVFIGVRPLIKSHRDPSVMSREYKLDLHQRGSNCILHIYGGKLTTFPSLARRVAERLKSVF